MDDPPPNSAASTVFAIPELLEAILIAHAQQDQREQDWMGHDPRPIIALFPLQRINHAFACTIQQSPTLHNRMYGMDMHGTDPAAPLWWFLHPLHIYRGGWWFREVDVPDVVQFNVRMVMSDSGEDWWQVPPEEWKEENASWRNITVFPKGYEGLGLQLNFKTRKMGSSRPWTLLLKPEDGLTLGMVYDFTREILRDCEPQLGELLRMKALQFAERRRELERLRIAFYGEEVNAAYSRGSSPPEVREEYKEQYWKARREEGRDFPAWQRALRRREHQTSGHCARYVCEFCSELDEGEA
ncbi:uncharacterized protein RCC_09949 [Ramularia collo-cygni]|uniref:Uncharacterized protein n=1 Tax=Ramularia collo-cygni TaxID=112498 RepID=A0A2D3VIT1_9PEZI|nr:uncharacterized protein RCC_09949 [Ramularia collo-cygni]CZT24231.1 uncharacterized protein RCC_09949 [Ramularia collo-cygni]